MASTYTKSLSVDFGGNLDSYQLHTEITNHGGIAPSITSINVGDPTADTVKITFDSALSGVEQTTLDTVISDHNPDPAIFRELMFKTITSSQSPFKVRKKSIKCDTSGGNITLNLPKAARSKEGILGFKKLSASNTVTIDARGSELIDGQLTKTLTALCETLVIKSNGTGWDICTTESTGTALNQIMLPISTTKGSLQVDNGDCLTEFVVGTNDQVIVADSTTDTGLKYGNLSDISGYAAKEHIDWTADAGADNIHDNNILASSITQHEASINHDNLTGFVAAEHYDWTADQGVNNIHQNNITSASVTQHESSVTIGNLSGAPTGSVVGTSDTQTLTNKTFTDFSTYIADNADNTKKVQFQVSGVTTGNTRTLTIPDANTTIVGTDATQTLTNKTINADSNTIVISTSDVTSGTFADARIASSNVTQHENSINILNLTGAPTGTVVGTSDSQTLTNKTLTAPIISTISNTGTLTLPTSTDTLVGRATTDTLTNKTWGDNLHMGSNKITNLATPTADSDAANKSYVDGIALGLDVKESVFAASTVDLDSNFSISGTASYNATGGTSGRGQFTATLVTQNLFILDGAVIGSAQDGSRILLKNQTINSENGIYTTTVSGTSLTLDRATDYDSDDEVTAGAFCFVAQGSTNNDTGWILTSNDPITVGGSSGDALSYTQFSGAGSISAGTGMTKTGDTLNVVGSDTIIANANDLEIRSSVTSNQTLLSAGSFGLPPTWGALPLGDTGAVTGTLAVANGGTGASTHTSNAILKGNGTGAVASSGLTIDGSDHLTTPGRILGANGTESLPMYSFSSDPDTGMYREGANYLGFAVGGAKKFRIDSSGIIYVQNEIQFENAGSSTDPALTWSLDSDTGFYRVASGQIGITCNGTQIAEFSATNKFEIDGIVEHTENSGVTVEAVLIKDGLVDGRDVSADGTALDSHTAASSAHGVSGNIVGTSSAQTLTNKTINTASNTITVSASDVSSGTFANARIAASNVTQHEGSINIQNLTGAPTGTVVGTTDTQTLTNKTLTSSVLTTPQINDTSANHQYIFGVNELVADRTVTLPLLTGNDVFTFNNHSQTLTNKTINTASNTITISASDVSSGTFANGRIGATNVTQHEGSINIQNLSGAPSGNVVGTSDTQTLTNKTINTASNTITVATGDVTSGTFANARIAQSNVTQHEGAINHNNLTGFVTNEHINHASVSITAGTGLTGGGTIASTRTIDLDINGLTADSNPNGALDYVATYDASAGTHKKVLLDNLPEPYDGVAIGDILIYDGTTYTNLGIGNNGDILTVDTGQDIDVKWAIPTWGEINTASNIGTSGVGLYDSKSGYDLRFKKINSTSATSGIVIVDDTGNNEVDVRLSINSLTADASPARASDYVLTYDASAGSHKKVLLDNLPGNVGGPTSALDLEVAVFDGTSGETIKGSGRRDYGASATDPVSPTPQAGDRYYNTAINHEMCYDASRSKWLSVATLMDGGGRNGTTAANVYYKRWNGMAMAATVGPHVAKGTIIRVGYGTSTAVTHTYEVLLNGTQICELASGGAASAFATFNADFNAGIMTSRNKLGSATTTNLQSTIYYKLRA